MALFTAMIRLELLGRVEVVDPENPRTSTLLRQPKCLALLVYLVLAGPGVFRSRDGILALFWPESNQRRARTALSQIIYRLRKSVGSEAIVTRGDGEVGIEPATFWCDAIAFTQALERGDPEAAAELYRGDLLPGYFLDDAPGFERWVDEQRTRLRNEARRATGYLAEAAVDAQLVPAATKWARRSAELSHDDEPSLQELLRLLARVGDRSGALHAYRDFANHLSREFEAEPSEETRRLIEEIRGRPGSIPDERETRSIGSRSTGTPVRVPTSSPEHRPPISRPDEDDDATVGLSPDDAPSRLLPSSVRLPGGAGRRIRWRLIALALIVCVASLAAVFSRGMVHRGRLSQPERMRIAVSDFIDLNSPSRPGVLAPAITAEVVSRLAAVPLFEVSSRNVAASSGSHSSYVAPPAGFVVTGSVVRSGARVRVDVALVDASVGSTLKTAALERESPDSLALVDALAREVSSMVRIAIGQEVRIRSTDAARVDDRAREFAAEAIAERERAHDLARQGRLSPAALSLLRADTLLRRAEAIAPTWREPMILRARVGLELAVLHVTPAFRDPLRARAYLEMGIGEAQRAVAHHHDDAVALETLGLLSYWYWLQVPLAPDSASLMLTRAMAVLRSAVEADPHRASAWDILGAALYARADYADAYMAALRAYQTDAYLDDAEQTLNRLFLTAYEMGDDALARNWCDEINERFQESWTGANCRLSLMAWGDSAGSPADAWRAMRIIAEGDVQAALDRGARPRLYMLAAAVLARDGLRDSAESLIHRARMDAAGDPEMLPLEAGALLLLGRSDTATARLARYLRERPQHRAGVACSRRFAALRRPDLEHGVFDACNVGANFLERRTTP